MKRLEEPEILVKKGWEAGENGHSDGTKRSNQKLNGYMANGK